MKCTGQILSVIALLCAVPSATAEQKAKNSDSPMHVITCTIEKVNQCLLEEAAAGYTATHVATTIMNRPRSTTTAGYGIWRSEDPVLVTQKSGVPKRQTIAIIDDLAKREQHLNEAGAAGMRLLPNELAALRSWSGEVSVDGYVALFEQVTPSKRFEYKVVDVTRKAAPDELKEMLAVGFRSVAFVAPAIVVLERGTENVPDFDEYRVLQAFDPQRIGTEVVKAATPGFRVVTCGVSISGLLTTVLLEHESGGTDKIEYQTYSASSSRELERKLNEGAQNGYSPVAGGILAITTTKKDYRGMTPPPQRTQVIVEKLATPKYKDFIVLSAFSKDLQSKLDVSSTDGYSFVEFVGVTNDNFVILGRPASTAKRQAQ